ncbi:MAG: hypothetical protein GY720_18420 [bacterium]|nr:hypothetical protein [bacterium]
MAAKNPSPLEAYRVRVAPGWIDYNGHMNEGYYAVAFGEASDAYMMQAGFGEEYREQTRGTFYTVETHIRYLRELKLNDPLVFRTTILGVDAKKLHLFHSMEHAEQGYEAATQEAFFLHVNLDSVAVAPMETWLLRAIELDRDAHRAMRPEGVGHAIKSIGLQE